MTKCQGSAPNDDLIKIFNFHTKSKQQQIVLFEAIIFKITKIQIHYLKIEEEMIES